ncbi:MAG: phosphonate ABC transporter, permease protein PhnE [Chloroflexi bacterium]|nr:phosphonate ABC transporter, permease protein PhnE [Chloroflexota bacterium]
MATTRLRETARLAVAPPARGFSFLNALLILVSLAAVLESGWHTNVSIAAFFDPSNVKGITRFITGLFPPDLSGPFLVKIFSLIRETMEISIVGTALAVVFAIPLSLAALRYRGEERSRQAQGTGAWLARWAVYYGARGTLNTLRAVPELVWALVFVVAVGLGPFPGVLALAAHGTGILGKLYAELLESVDQRLVETVRSTGATESLVTAFARVPVALPMLVSYTLFRWECNMRAATVLGFVGAGGIGTELVIAMKLFSYHEVLTLVIAIAALVFIVDIVGQIVRTRLLDAPVVTTCRPGEGQGALQRLSALFGRGDA